MSFRPSLLVVQGEGRSNVQCSQCCIHITRRRQWIPVFHSQEHTSIADECIPHSRSSGCCEDVCPGIPHCVLRAWEMDA